MDPPPDSAANVPVVVEAREAIFPQSFFAGRSPQAQAVYLTEPCAAALVRFFQDKGVAALKEEDRRQEWYLDWLAYQAQHHLYADLLSPSAYSTRGGALDLLRLTKFFEIFGYCSPSHGYSLQVSFLGLFSILMGSNRALRQEAIESLEAGGLFAFGISEKQHGSDLLANTFAIRRTSAGSFIANGSKYYIGNANAASIISILARKEDERSRGGVGRAPLALFALRPSKSRGFEDVRKIQTMGVRAAFVGEFQVKDHEFPESDLIAEGRKAWDAVFGAVTLGKFFLGFGQIGICEHAWEEATAHLGSRVLFGKPALEMPHLRATLSEAYVRLTAMKLYAYRALDYVQIASADDRRYQLFNAVQKARVSTEGVKVMGLLSECIGAKGFEADGYFEMAIRDAQLIPGLEGSAHINLLLAAQFLAQYLMGADQNLAVPKSSFSGELAATENNYLMEASTRNPGLIRFPCPLEVYRRLMGVPNVRLFVKQAIHFRQLIRRSRSNDAFLNGPETALALGGCLAIIIYAQLVAENCVALQMPSPVVSAVFHLLVRDLAVLALSAASLPGLTEMESKRLQRLIIVPERRGPEWDFIGGRFRGKSSHSG